MNSEIRRAQDKYLRAVNAARDESLSEAGRRKAATALVEARHALDDLLVERVEAFEQVDDDELREARERVARIAFGGSASSSSAELRDLFRPADPNRSVTQQASVELRLEYPLQATDAASGFGSYAVPTSVPNLIVQSLVDESGVLAAGPTVIRSASGEPMRVPTLGTAPTAAAYRTEGAAATETDAILGKADITVSHIAGYLQASAEFIADAAPDAEREIVRMCAAAVGRTLATELATGSGAVARAFTSAAHGATADSGTTFTADELLDLRASLGTAYRGPRSAWIMSDAAYTIALKLTGDTGDYLLTPGAGPNLVDMLWGSPVYVDSYGPAVSSGNHVVLYGRPDSYWLRLVGGVEITRSDEFAHTSWLSTFRFGLRAGGAIVDTAGLKALVMA